MTHCDFIHFYYDTVQPNTLHGEMRILNCAIMRPRGGAKTQRLELHGKGFVSILLAPIWQGFVVSVATWQAPDIARALARIDMKTHDL